MWDGSTFSPEESYKLVTFIFMAAGKDGFECFKDPKVSHLTDKENAKTLHRVMYGALEQLSP